MHYKWCTCNKEGLEIYHNIDHNILDEIFEERVKEKNRVINNQPSIGFVCSPWNHPTTWFSIVHYSSSSFFFSYLSTFFGYLGNHGAAARRNLIALFAASNSFVFFQTLSWPALGWLGCTSPLSWIEITNTSAQYHHHFSVMNCFYLAIRILCKQ